MITWFARFKNRFGKLEQFIKKRSRKGKATIIAKSSKKASKMDPKCVKKPLKNLCGIPEAFSKAGGGGKGWHMPDR